MSKTEIKEASKKQWLEAIRNASFDLWGLESLEIEKESCLEFIEKYKKLGNLNEVERLELKVNELQNIINKK